MKNMLSVKEFLLEQLFWIVIGYIWYRNIFFTNLDGMTRFQSHLVLFGLIITVGVINLIFSGSWSRNTFSVIVTVLIPFGIYTMLVYYKYVPGMYRLIYRVSALGIVVVLLVVSVAGLYAEKHNPVKRRKKIRSRFARIGYKGVRIVVGCAAVVALVGLFGKSYFFDSMAEPKNVAAADVNSLYDVENCLAYNINTMTGLVPETWETLSIDEKMDILQITVNIEGRYLGFDKSIRIVAAELDGNALGYYNDEKGLIVINVDLLFEDPHRSVETVTHECRHAAQHTLVRIYEKLDERQQNSIYMWDASVYKDEFENYIDGEESFYQYHAQKCETDARNYSNESTEEIYERIEKYLSTGDAGW